MNFLETIKEKTISYSQYKTLKTEYVHLKEEVGEDLPPFEEWKNGDAPHRLFEQALKDFAYYLQGVFKGYDWFLYSCDVNSDYLIFVDINDDGSIKSFVDELNERTTHYSDDFRFYGRNVVCAGRYGDSKGNNSLLMLLGKYAIKGISPHRKELFG